MRQDDIITTERKEAGKPASSRSDAVDLTVEDNSFFDCNLLRISVEIVVAYISWIYSRLCYHRKYVQHWQYMFILIFYETSLLFHLHTIPVGMDHKQVLKMYPGTQHSENKLVVHRNIQVSLFDNLCNFLELFSVLRLHFSPLSPFLLHFCKERNDSAGKAMAFLWIIIASRNMTYMINWRPFTQDQFAWYAKV